jgi:hypothetical protein
MRRALLTSLSALAVAVAMPATLTPSALGAPGDARARLASCHRHPAQLMRSLTVDSTMQSLREGDRLQMRFYLFRRWPTSLVYRRLRGPGLGSWTTASRGTDVYRVRKPIQNLPAPAFYYVVVSYRWLDDDGAVLARTARRTGVCFQPDLRPDLRLGLFDVRPLNGESARYSIVVRNDGRTATRDFDVLLSVNGDSQPAVTMAGLAAGARREVVIVGPRCRSGTVSLRVDPDDRVDEAGERNNTRTVACIPV